MWLAVDSGNSRIKWGLFDGERLVEFAVVEDVASLAAVAGGREVWFSHVGGDVALRRLLRALSVADSIVRAQSRVCACGVVNRYRPPESLGADRWLALLAARRRRLRAIIVSAGTAATIDALPADGVFRGGWILPGITTMLTALAQKTALPLAQVAPMPALSDNTSAAQAAGATFAIAGAAREFRRRFLPSASFLVTGGGAPSLLPFLPAATHAPHLVLRGLARLRAADG